MIKAREIDEYRTCDLGCCREEARWEFTKASEGGRPYRVFVCGAHEVEGFARVRELA